MTDRSQDLETAPMTDPLPSSSRRQLLQVGGLGALGAAFLAACGSDAYATEPGVAGPPAPPTTAPPTVPQSEPNSAQRAAEQVELHTLASVEALLAETYQAHASVLTDDELRGAAERYAGDHAAAAALIATWTEDGEADGANEDLKEHLVTPVERSLEALSGSNAPAVQREANIQALRMFTALETSLAATYINSMQNLNTAGRRGEFATFGSAAARRAAVLDDGGAGAAPSSALFPARDLIPGSVYLGGEEEAASEEDEAEGDEAES